MSDGEQPTYRPGKVSAKRFLFVMPLLLLLIAGCSDGNGSGRSGSPTAVPATATQIATATLAPATATAPLSPSMIPATATASPTAPQTSTPSDTSPPTATPTQTPTLTSSPTPTDGGIAVRAAPYDVRDTTQPHQLSVFNDRPGGGSVGMPVRFGDFDGDGNGDFVACPMLADSGPSGARRDSGEVHIYFGSGVISGVIVNTPEAERITTFMGARAGDLLGTLADVGDVNADGFADLLIGAQNHDGLARDRKNAGGAFLYYGRAQNPRTIDVGAPPEGFVTIFGEEPGDRLGVWVNMGDVDGDGALDLILGADQADGPNNERPNAGAVYVIFGDQELPATIDLAAPGGLRIAVIHGLDAGDHFGATIVAADVDKDGLDDLVAGGGLARGSSQIDGTFLAGGDGPGNTRPNAGEVYVLFSRVPFPDVQDLASLSAAERVTVYGADASDVAGEELAVGDLDGDGRVDIAIGSLLASGPQGPESSRGRNTGRAYVIFDAASRRGEQIDLARPGSGITTIFGKRRGVISGDTLIVADMDGDGIDDLWDASPSLGTRDAAGVFRPASGVVDIIFGRSVWPATIDLLLPADDLRLVSIYGADANDQFAYGLAVGDADGDGKLDVISNGMAGDGFENQARNAGELYVIANEALFDQTPATPAPLFLNIDIQPIFEAACVPCHAGDMPSADLRLDVIRDTIVDLLGADGMGRSSTQVDDLRVRAGDPDQSYLIEKLEATEEVPARVGDPMPVAPADRLPSRVIRDIRRWIAEGAKVANENLPPPPPLPVPKAQGFATTFFARMRFVLSDPNLGEINSVLLDPPAPIPFRIIGPELTVPTAEFEPVMVPSDFGPIEVVIREDGRGTLDRTDGTIELSITFIQIALGGAVENVLPATLSTGEHAAGPFVTVGQPLDPVGGTLKLVGIAVIPEDTPTVGGDFVLVELEGSVAPTIPEVPSLSDEIQPIFTSSCALVNCHIGDGAAQLNLESGRAFGELIDVPSTQVEDLLVTPGEPERSYLFEKITMEMPRVGDRMPIGNVLDALDVEAIRLWIAGDAPE